MVPFEDSFLIVGGRRGTGEPINNIYKYQVEDGSWKVLEAKLPRKASQLTAMMVGVGKDYKCGEP